MNNHRYEYVSSNGAKKLVKVALSSSSSSSSSSNRTPSPSSLSSPSSSSVRSRVMNSLEQSSLLSSNDNFEALNRINQPFSALDALPPPPLVLPFPSKLLLETKLQSTPIQNKSPQFSLLNPPNLKLPPSADFTSVSFQKESGSDHPLSLFPDDDMMESRVNESVKKNGNHKFRSKSLFRMKKDNDTEKEYLQPQIPIFYDSRLDSEPSILSGSFDISSLFMLF
jgi:hypothetical protein